MNITVKYFGMIADITTKTQEEFPLDAELHTTEKLRQQLEKLYPVLEKTTFSIAINQRLIQENTELQSQDEVALLPPFAGG